VLLLLAQLFTAGGVAVVCQSPLALLELLRGAAYTLGDGAGRLLRVVSGALRVLRGEENAVEY
jgi:hypothetical protein